MICSWLLKILAAPGVFLAELGIYYWLLKIASMLGICSWLLKIASMLGICPRY